WPVASLLLGHRSTRIRPLSRLATGQMGRNERHCIYVHDHLAMDDVESEQAETTAQSRDGGCWIGFRWSQTFNHRPEFYVSRRLGGYPRGHDREGDQDQ